MTPTLYRYRDTESVINVMEGYAPGEGWEPLYSQAEVNKLQAQLVRQQASYEAEIKVEIDSALDRAVEICDAINADYTARYAAPAWHDAPTVPGVWVNSETWMSYNHDGLGKPIPGRRYGPIPADKE